MKTCSICEFELPEECFAKGRSQCRECLKKYHRKYYRNNKEASQQRNHEWRQTNRIKRREYMREYDKKYAFRRKWRKYKLSSEEYHSLLEAQNNSCAICFCQSRPLVVDHSHVTGKVRGFLCRQCNTGIGLLGDEYVGISSAADYLLRSLEENQVLKE